MAPRSRSEEDAAESPGSFEVIVCLEFRHVCDTLKFDFSDISAGVMR